MTILSRIAHRLRRLFRRRQSEADMQEEMRYHLEQRAADLAAEGLSAEESRFAAQRKFGNTASLQEIARESYGWGWLERLVVDLRVAAKQLIRSPGFSILAIVTLGLGIGANTTMFSLYNGVALKPLPYADQAQLDRIYRATAQDPRGDISAADYLDLRRAEGGFGEFAAYSPGDVSLAEPGHPAEMAHAVRVSANFLSLLGTQVQRGRDFAAGEDSPGRDRVVILSQRTWRNRYESARDIVGRTIRVDGEPHQIVGVLPESFNDWRHLGWVDLFRPLALDQKMATDRTATNLRVIGRRSTGLAPAAAAGFIEGFGVRQATGHPEANAGSTWRAVTLHSTAIGRSGAVVLKMLIGLSGFVLLIACSNLANLLLARTMARAREFAVRAALGASRTQLLRPLIAESLLLALAGGGAAILVTLWGCDWLALRSTGDNGEQVHVLVEWTVLGWALAASLVTALVFGIAPALFALRLNLNHTLKSGGRGATGGRGHHVFRRVLIVGQFALAMVLLAGAGLFVNGLHDLNHRRDGWESAQLVTGDILLPAARYADDGQTAAFHRLVRERLAALPGVAAASISSASPMFNWPEVRRFIVEGRERPEPGREPAARVNRVSPGYFDTYGTRVLSGRVFHEQDTAGSTRVFIISESTARGLFAGQDPIGRRLAAAEGDDLRWGEVVGVVRDVNPAVEDPSPVPYQIYLPLAQEPSRYSEIAVRAAGVAPSALVEGIRSTMAALDPDLPVRHLQPADRTITRRNYQLAVLRDMLSAIALLGLGLASLGIYGVIARTMAQRTGEFAIRLALGARVQHISRLVLVSGVKLALVGATLGLLGAVGVSQLLIASFPGMRMDSPPVVIGAVLVLIGVALVACWLPARRAGKVDAMVALRAE